MIEIPINFVLNGAQSRKFYSYKDEKDHNFLTETC